MHMFSIKLAIVIKVVAIYNPSSTFRFRLSGLYDNNTNPDPDSDPDYCRVVIQILRLYVLTVATYC